MRKGHQKLLDRAKEKNLPDKYIRLLENRTEPLDYIEACLGLLENVKTDDLLWLIGKKKSDIKFATDLAARGENEAVIKKVIADDLSKDKLQDLLRFHSLEEAYDIMRFTYDEDGNFRPGLKSTSIFEYEYKCDHDLDTLKEFAIKGFSDSPLYVRAALRCGLTPEDLRSLCRGEYLDYDALAMKTFPELYELSDEYKYRLNYGDPEEIRKASEPLFKVVTGPVTLEIPLSARYGAKHLSSYSIHFMKFKQTRFFEGTDNVFGEHLMIQTKVIVSYSGEIFRETKNGRLIPFTIKDIAWCRNAYEDLFEEFLEKYVSHFDSPVFKDVLNMEPTASLLPPIPLNKCIGKRTPQELAEAHYKSAAGINWNRLGLQKGYLYMKARKLVDEQSQGILKNYIYNSNIIDAVIAAYRWRDVDPGLFVLEEILLDKTGLKPKLFESYCVRDYIRTKRLLKEKISLRFNGKNSIKDTHDQDANRYRVKAFPKGSVVPKKSKFRSLRRKLPKEFELLSTAKRFQEEADQQHNCVATYIRSVQEDECAIYSWVHLGERYTIEFRKDGSDFKIIQMMKKYNEPAESKIVRYVEELIA